MVVLQANDIGNTINETGNFFSALATQDAFLAAITFLFAALLAYLFFTGKAENKRKAAAEKRESERAERREQAEDDYRKNVTNQLTQIGTGIVANTTTIANHEKEIAENNREIRDIARAHTKLEKEVTAFTAKINSWLDFFQPQFDNLEKRVRKIEEEQAEK